MDNEALMRRISATTGARKPSTAAPPPADATAKPRFEEPMMRESRPVNSQNDISPHPQMRSESQSAPIGTHQAVQPATQPQVMQQAVAEQMAPAAPAIPHDPAPLVAESAPSIAADEPLMTFIPPETKKDVEVPDQRRTSKEERPEAFVIACNGSMAVVQGDTSCVDTITGLTWAVGRMLSIVVGESRIVGMVCDIKMPKGEFSPAGKAMLRFSVELQGEVTDGGEGNPPKFNKGIASYPGVGSIVHQIRAADLQAIYASTGSGNAYVGDLSQDDSIPAYVDVPDMLSKHFAVLGSTGCGKSASVSLLLHAAQEVVPDLRTIILDPHNEYSRAFPNANTIEQTNLDLPFWMLQLEEYVEVLFRGKPIVHEEVDALREFIPEAKIKFRDGEDRVQIRTQSSASSFTADTAVPYRIADLLALIDEEMGLLDSNFDKSILKSLKARITAHCNDARYGFMFRHRTIEDIAESVISDFFCLPGKGGTLATIIQMAGMPAEVVNAVASVLCRLAFELAIAAKGNLKILVVCEEAHRYVPAGKDGFEPTRRAIARIAKEGRKYGSFMAIISQRPSELDPTILSQCSTVFSLRLTNDFDQDIIRRAISSSSASTIAFISSLANREAIAFGEGMSTPMRLRFRFLPQQWLPGAEADVFGNSTAVCDAQQSRKVFLQWRGNS
ncbi:MAG: ATP-binding protein [Rhizobiaceae bacterium]